MEVYTLDTSGFVRRPGFAKPLGWSDLDPFEQGYIEAAKRTFPALAIPEADGCAGLDWGFRHLAPETLAAMIADCAEVAPDGGLNGYLATNASAVADARGAGAEFWRRRNRLTFKRFPPVTLYLGDDGKVRQSIGEAA